MLPAQSVGLCGLLCAGFAAAHFSGEPQLSTEASKGCKFTAHVDYDTTSGSVASGITSQQACCDKCLAVTDCKVGVWQQSTGKCYLKEGIVTPVPKQTNITACIARENPKPEPEYDCTQKGADCAGRLGATHWNPCYFINSSAPSLLDGAQSVHSMGSRVIKVALFGPKGNYPFNSPDWPENSKFDTLVSMAKHAYYRSLWNMDFDTFVLIAYSTVGGAAGGDISYWTKGISPEQEASESKQLYDAAAFFISEYPGKTFVFENWEGDWASRAGGYDASKPATDLALSSMTKWLAARQAGVTKARSEHRAHGATGNVYFAAEVNLVHDSLTTGAPNMINRVIPKVALDMVSYSSYDSMNSLENFKAAIQYIVKQHKRTAASPPGARAFFVAEYGLAQQTTKLEIVQKVVKNVVNSALAFGAAYVLFWETYCNECTGGKGCSGGRCHDSNNAVNDPSRLNGFWLVKPDGSYSWPRSYLSAKINGDNSAGSSPTFVM